MRIIITGSPGSGKSAIARELAGRMSLPLIDVKKIIAQKRLKAKNKEVDPERLGKALKFLREEEDFVAENHLLCEIRLPHDFIFVLRCHPSVLGKRLSKRRYSNRKIEENLMAEMLDYCTQRVVSVYKEKPLELDTSKRSVLSCAREIEKAIRQKKKKLDSVDYSAQLKKQLHIR